MTDPTHTTRRILTLFTVALLVLAPIAGAAILATPAAAQDNSVAFDGEVTIDADPASDSATFTYELVNASGADDFTATFTGASTERDQSTSGTFVGSNSTTIDVAGTLAPGGPASGSPQVSATLDPVTHNTESRRSYYGENGPNPLEFNHTVAAPQDTITDLRVQIQLWDAFNQEYHTDVEAVQEIRLNGEVVASGLGGNRYDDGDWFNYTNLSVDSSGSDEAVVTIIFDDGCACSDNAGGVHQTIIEGPQPSAADVSVDGSQVGTVDHNGSTAIDLSTGTTDVGISAPAFVDYSIEWTERSPTTDPTLEVNGHTVSYSGTLSVGETRNLSVDEAWLQDGTNQVNVTTGSAGGIQTVVGLDYNHTASVSQTTSYESETWSERYNVTRTYTSSQSGVEMTIPFESSRVVSIRDVEIYNDGSWRSANSSEYSLDKTTISIQIGDVSENETVAVRANASKVNVQSGGIQVTNPTVEGNDLSSSFEVTDDGGATGLEIAVGGTDSGGLLHYLAQSSWTPNERSVIDSNGQLLRMPEAPQGGTATVETAPLEITPRSGDVVAILEDPAEPRFTLRSGDSTDNTVEVRWLNAESGETYDLTDAESGAVVDRETANSPVLFETTDDERTYIISLFDGDTSGGSSGGGGGALGPISADQNPTPWTSLGIPLGILAIAVGVILLFVARVRYGSSDGASASGPLEYVSSIAGRGGSWIADHPTVGAGLAAVAGFGLLASGAISVPAGTVPALFTVSVPLVSYYALKRIGRFDPVVWGLSSGAALVIGLVWMGVDLFDQLINSQVSLILAIGGLYLLYRALKSYMRGKTTKIVLSGNRGGNQ